MREASSGPTQAAETLGLDDLVGQRTRPHAYDDQGPPLGGVVHSVVKECGMVQVNLSKGLDKAYEDKSLAEILAAPPSALAGLTPAHDAALKQSFGIDTVAELGSNKYFALAGVLVALATKEG